MKIKIIILIAIVLFISNADSIYAAENNTRSDVFSISVENNHSPKRVSVVLEIFALLTILSLAPAILIMLTSFTRIVIVLSILKQAMGTHGVPPNQVIVGMALFLTFFIMMPVYQNINEKAIKPYLNEKIDHNQAIDIAMKPVRNFMLKQTRKDDISLFISIAKLKKPENAENIPTSVLIPSFIISELKTAFQIGFILFIPFLIIDMVVSSVLLSMGMMMLPPIMISLPFKLILFVLVDGWNLIVGSLVKSFG
jgi:flagellar biosynthetic protein FliP